MRIAGTVQDSIVDGPGFRFTVFVQGCLRNCEGCHNTETQDPDGGTERSAEDVIAEMLSNPMTDGLTLSGGEPFLQPGECAKIAKAAVDAGLNVWAYSGYTFEELYDLAHSSADIWKLLSLLDVLVDGAFVLSQRSLAIKWRGSANQRIIDVRRSLEDGKAVDMEV